mgnify:CR=1 FL=1
MTFVEAAVQILRREGKPLHVKELTRLAIKHNLLSVVGRDPVAERWIHCFTQDQLFLGACDAHQLGRVIELFLAWVDDAPPTA